MIGSGGGAIVCQVLLQKCRARRHRQAAGGYFRRVIRKPHRHVKSLGQIGNPAQDLRLPRASGSC